MLALPCPICVLTGTAPSIPGVTYRVVPKEYSISETKTTFIPVEN